MSVSKLRRLTKVPTLPVFANLRCVSRLFNDLVGPIVFADTVINVYSDAVKPITKAPYYQQLFEKRVKKLESMAEQADSSPRSGDLEQDDGLEKDHASVWRWTKSLKIRQEGQFSTDSEESDAYVQKLVRAIRGFRSIQRVR